MNRLPLNRIRAVSAALFVIGCLAGCGVHVGYATQGPSAPLPPPRLPQVDAAAVRILQVDRSELFPFFASHHALAVVCVAHTYGTDPPNATDVALVKTAYVWAECAERLPGGQMGDDVSIPAVVDLTGTGRVAVPGEDVDYAPDIARLFPDRLQPYFAPGYSPDEPDMHRTLLVLVSATPS